MRKVILTATLCIAIIAALIFAVCPTLAYETTAVTPRFELLTPGVARSFTITQFNNFPQDFSFFLVLLIGYGPFSIELSSLEDSSEGDLFVISGVGISPAGIRPFLKFGRANVDLSVGIEIGNERNPYGIVWFSSWIASPLEEETSYALDIIF
jgi:hypothetical protein